MAPWEELVLACNLKADVPQQVLDILIYLISDEADETSVSASSIATPDHYFFNESREYRWQDLLGGPTGYFPGEVFARLSRNSGGFVKLTMRTMVRLGENLIKAFLDWLAPYCETQGFVGYTRCDEIPASVDLIHFENGIVYYYDVALYKHPATVERLKITKSDNSANDT